MMDRKGLVPVPVVIESPYAGAIADNLKYARKALLDSLKRGEAPFASHLLYTQVLQDMIPKEREAGIAANLSMIETIGRVVVYEDLGISPGMAEAIALAVLRGFPVEHRRLSL